VNANVIGALVSGLSALLFVILALLSFRSRRSSNEARDLRAVRATNVAALRWAYQVQVTAAVRGWELPSVPLEMTPEYLAGKAAGEGNPELAQLAQLAQALIPPGNQTGDVHS
jgi:hypothetical protein